MLGLSHWFYEKLWRKIDPQDQFLTIQFDLTNACNLRCSHCYCPHHRNQGSLNFEQWVAILHQYKNLLDKLHMQPNITLCGGEPLLCPFLFDFIREIRYLFPTDTLYLLTNGTQINKDTALKLKLQNVKVQVSIDGPDAKRHDLIRGNGSWTQALEGCSFLKEAGVSFHHLTVLSKRTSAWINDFFLVPKITGATAMSFVRLVTEGHARQLKDENIDRPLYGFDLKSAYEAILKKSKESKVPTNTHDALWCLIDPTLGSPNNIGVTGMVIGYKGEFKVSSRTSMVLGNVLQSSLEDLFLNHPIMKKLRDGTFDKCGECPHFGHCGGDRNASFAEYGHFFGPDPGCWILYPEGPKSRGAGL